MLNVVWMEREFDAYKLSRSMYPSIFNSFPVIRTASAKNRHFHVPPPTFLFPWRRPCDYHAICCMDGIRCLQIVSLYVPIYNYYRFWDTARYLWKNRHFIIPLTFDAPVRGSRRNIGTPFGTEKLEWCRYPMVKNFRRYLYSFWRDPRTWRTDRRTDRHCMTAKTALASHRAVKTLW